jgi:CDP-diacylglycerol--glycerol-3-phosphate 3-phosphatidyltransferase
VAAIGSLMVSYAKARAEGLGLECRTGLLARPERVVILAIGLLTGTTIWALALLAVFSHVTAGERIVHVWLVSTRPLALNAGQVSANGLGPNTDGNLPDRHVSIETDEVRDTSVESVSTSLPPLTGSIHPD